MGQLDQVLKDKQRQRDNLRDEATKIDRLIRSTSEKLGRVETEMAKQKKEADRREHVLGAERDAHKTALQELEDRALQLKRGIDEIHREIEGAEQMIKSDLQFKAANDNNKNGSKKAA